MFRRRPSLPSALDIEEQRARIQKLRAETELATLQLSRAHQGYERMKAIAAIGGLVTGIAAVLGLLLSTVQWLRSEESARQLQIEERLDHSLALLGGENAATRLAAVVSLGSFLKRNSPHSSAALQALTNALAIEESITVRNAIVATIQRVDSAGVSDVELSGALESLLLVSRGLVAEGDLWNNRRTSVFATPAHNTVESRALSVAAAISILLHKGARSSDMSRIYLSSVDLSDLDLAGTRWDDAILPWTDFSNCDLSGASFKDSDLESTLFVKARLARADFGVSADPLAAKRRFNYVRTQMHRSQTMAHQVRAQERFTIHGPDFSCADLAGADFSGHPLVPIYLNEYEGAVDSYASFLNANLTGATFSRLRGFGIVRVGQSADAQPFPTVGSSAGWGSTDQYATTEFELRKDGPLRAGWESYTEALKALSNAFGGSNWRAARFDQSVYEALDKLNVYNVEQPRCEAQS